MPEQLPAAMLDQIAQSAAHSEIAHFRWKNRGVAPLGCINGMALVYARVYGKLRGSPSPSTG